MYDSKYWIIRRSYVRNKFDKSDCLRSTFKKVCTFIKTKRTRFIVINKLTKSTSGYRKENIYIFVFTHLLLCRYSTLNEYRNKYISETNYHRTAPNIK